MSRAEFEDDENDRMSGFKRTLIVAVVVLFVVGLIFYFIFNGSELFGGGATKYMLTGRRKIQAIGYGMFYATTDSYVQLTNVNKENGYIKSGNMLIHIVFDDGSWREYEGRFYLQNNTSSGQYYLAPYDSPWTEFKIADGTIIMLYTSTSGLVYNDLTFK